MKSRVSSAIIVLFVALCYGETFAPLSGGTVYEVSPKSAPYFGGTLITFTGANIGTSQDIDVRIGGISLTATPDPENSFERVWGRLPSFNIGHYNISFTSSSLFINYVDTTGFTALPGMSVSLQY